MAEVIKLVSCYLLMMRPVGVVSKNDKGEYSTLLKALSCIELAVLTIVKDSVRAAAKTSTNCISAQPA